MTPRDRWAIFIHEMNYSPRTCKMRFLYRVSPDDFQRNSLRIFPWIANAMEISGEGRMNASIKSPVSSRATRYSKRRAFWYGFLLRYVKDLRLTWRLLVTVSLETRCGRTLLWYYISYISVLGKRYSARCSAEFSPIVITFIIKLYPFFCRSPCRQISNFLSCNLVTPSPCVAKVGFVWRKIAQRLAIFNVEYLCIIRA